MQSPQKHRCQPSPPRQKVSANHGKFADESDLLLVGLEESRFRSLIDRVLILADQQIADRARDLFASIEPVELAAQQLRQGLIRYRSLQVGYRRNEGFTGAPRELDMISKLPRIRDCPLPRGQPAGLGWGK